MSFKQEPLVVRIYVVAVVAAGLLFLSLNIPDWSTLGLPFFGFVLINAIMDNMRVPLPKGDGTVSVSFAIILAIIILFGYAAAAWASVSVIFYIKAFKNFKDRGHRYIFTALQMALSAGIAGYVYQYTGGNIGQFSLSADIGPVLATTAVFFLLNSIFIIAAISLSQKMSFFGSWLINFRWSVPNYLATFPLGILIAVIYTNMGIAGVLLLMIPLMVARHTFALYADMRNHYLGTIKALAKAIDAKDTYTHGHSERVAEYAVLIGKEMKLSEDFIDKLQYVALMHDIGKIAIPETVLNKPSRLSDSEFDIVKEHPAVGAEIIKNIKFFGDQADAVRHHHERMDGCGYPDGISGSEISLGARIVSVVDAYDAMTTKRIYRDHLSVQQAVDELKLCCNSQFCSDVVNAFEKALRRKGEIK